jgi:glycosyltransferase involved in cell wall biosynthesis
MTSLHLKAMRRIVHTIPAVADHSSGYTYSVTRLCESLIERGLDVQLGCVDKPGRRAIPDFVRAFPRSPGPVKLGASSKLHQWLRAAARAGEAGILHSHSLWHMPCVYPGWVSQWSWTPYIVSPRGTLSEAAFASGSRVKGTFWRFVQRPALLSATCFHATAESELADIRKHGFTQPVAVIPNGIDIPALARTHAKDRTLLFLGRVHPIKQPERLLESWQRLAPRFGAWRLKIVGTDLDSPGYLDRMKVYAAQMRLPRVEFAGELVDDEKFAAYRAADLYVLPSKSENFGITIAEALAAGTPVIATQGAPWGGLVSRRAGWWIKDDVETLSETLAEAMSKERGELEDMGARGRDWMLERFQWNSVADQVLHFYDWIVTGMPLATKPDWVHLAARGDAAASAAATERGKRWPSAQKAEVVMRILRGESLEALSRELGVSTARLAEWRDDGIAALRMGLSPD